MDLFRLVRFGFLVAVLAHRSPYRQVLGVNFGDGLAGWL